MTNGIWWIFPAMDMRNEAERAEKRSHELFRIIIDGRHKPQKIDLEFMEWLGENQVPFCIVFTKLDKLSSSAAKGATAAYCAQLLEMWEELPPIFRTSSVDRRGRQELLDYIGQLSKLPLEIEDPAGNDE